MAFLFEKQADLASSELQTNKQKAKMKSIIWFLLNKTGLNSSIPFCANRNTLDFKTLISYNLQNNCFFYFLFGFTFCFGRYLIPRLIFNVFSVCPRWCLFIFCFLMNSFIYCSTHWNKSIPLLMFGSNLSRLQNAIIWTLLTQVRPWRVLCRTQRSLRQVNWVVGSVVLAHLVLTGTQVCEKSFVDPTHFYFDH